MTFEVRRSTFSGNVPKCAMNSYAKTSGMKRPEQLTKINEIDYRGKTAPALMTADVLLPIPAPPPNRL